MINNRALIKEWKVAEKNLGIRITTPFDLQLHEGIVIHAPLLVHDFGGIKGTLVVTNYADIKQFIEELGLLGYGFSVLSEPSENDVYDQDAFIEMLNDWQWTGNDVNKPGWAQ